MEKGHLYAPLSLSSREFVMAAAARTGREGQAAREVIYGIYARTRETNRIISITYP
jgi:hypothetical protein